MRIDKRTTIIVALGLAVVLVVSYVIALSRFGLVDVNVDDSESAVSEVGSEDTNDVSDTSSETSSDTINRNEYEYYGDFVFKKVEYSNDAVISGSLAVVDGSACPNVDSLLASVYSNKTGGYNLSGTGLRLVQEAMTNIDKFAGDFCNLVSGSGLIIDKAYTNGSGVSGTDVDLITGYSVKFSIFGSKHNYTFESEDYIRLQEMAHEYGVILRYPSGKESYTGFEYDPKIYRYVGMAHTYYMNRYNMCLEEYLDKVRTEKIIEFRTANGSGTPYVVYYVPADQSGRTEISVPANAGYEYSISGDGTGGFIVTVKIQ